MGLELGHGVGRQFYRWRPEHGFDPKNCPFKLYGEINEWLYEKRMAENDAKGMGYPVLTEPIEYKPLPGLPGVYAWFHDVGRAQERQMGRFPTFGHPNGVLSSQFVVFHPTWTDRGGAAGWEESPAPPFPSLKYEIYVKEKDEFYCGPLQEAAQPFLARGEPNPYGYVSWDGPGVPLNRFKMGFPILRGLAGDTALWSADKGWITFEDSKVAKAPYAPWQLWCDEKRRWWWSRTTEDSFAEGSLDQVYVASASAPTPAPLPVPVPATNFYEAVLARGVQVPDEDYSQIDQYVFEGGLVWLNHATKKGGKIMLQ